MKAKAKKNKPQKTPPKEGKVSSVLEAVVYNEKGKENGKIKLPEKVFGLPWNSDLVHQVAVSYMSNKRNAIAHTKDRGDVRGGGKKPWRQKGTGRARHGSRRSPIWIGGGVTFGPTNEKNFDRKINSKMKNKALMTVLSKKMKDSEVLFVDNIAIKEPKTKEAKVVLKNLSGIVGFKNLLDKRKNSAHIFTTKKDKNLAKSFSNFSNIKFDEFRNVNTLDLLNSKHILIIDPENAVKFLLAKTSSGSSPDASKEAFREAKLK